MLMQSLPSCGVLAMGGSPLTADNRHRLFESLNLKFHLKGKLYDFHIRDFCISY